MLLLLKFYQLNSIIYLVVMYLNSLGLKHWVHRVRVPTYSTKISVDASRGQRAELFFGQRISIAIQRGNASLLGTFLINSDADEFFNAL